MQELRQALSNPEKFKEIAQLPELQNKIAQLPELQKEIDDLSKKKEGLLNEKSEARKTLDALKTLQWQLELKILEFSQADDNFNDLKALLSLTQQASRMIEAQEQAEAAAREQAARPNLSTLRSNVEEAIKQTTSVLGSKSLDADVKKQEALGELQDLLKTLDAADAYYEEHKDSFLVTPETRKEVEELKSTVNTWIFALERELKYNLITLRSKVEKSAEKTALVLGDKSLDAEIKKQEALGELQDMLQALDVADAYYEEHEDSMTPSNRKELEDLRSTVDTRILALEQALKGDDDPSVAVQPSTPKPVDDESTLEAKIKKEREEIELATYSIDQKKASIGKGEKIIESLKKNIADQNATLAEYRASKATVITRITTLADGTQKTEKISNETRIKEQEEEIAATTEKLKAREASVETLKAEVVTLEANVEKRKADMQKDEEALKKLKEESGN
jgi:DNA repair exonuclease SbcCD ATPase subunit